MRPELITSISDVLQQISTLTVANADLSESLSRERIIFGKIIYDLNNQLEAKQKENTKLTRYLHQAHEIMLDREHLIKELEDKIIALEKANAEMKQKAEEGLEKGWQLQELCDMLLGKKSEKFVPVAQDVDAAIQQTLGVEFDTLEIEEIIKVAISPSNISQIDQEIVKTSRKKSDTKPIKDEEYSHPGWKLLPRRSISVLIKPVSSPWAKR